MDPLDKRDLLYFVETHGLVSVLEALGDISRQKASERLRVSDEDPEYRDWHRAMKRLVVLSRDLRYTYLRNIGRGLGSKERRI